MRCPKCKKKFVIAVQNTDEHYHAERKCLDCGFSWYPYRIQPEAFWARELSIRANLAEMDSFLRDKKASLERKL